MHHQSIASGFNKKKPAERTVLVLLQIDLSKAFDMVSHEKLLKDLNKTSLPVHLKRLFSCYLHGRQSKVSFRNETSSSRNVRTGVPQGAVTSLILFNFYLFNLPTPPSNVKLVKYADDISIYACGVSISTLTRSINGYIGYLTDFLKRGSSWSPWRSPPRLSSPRSPMNL